MEREKSCCFSGHRPQKLPWGEMESDPRCVALKEELTRRLERAYDQGYRHFICGMAQGADFYFCEAAMALRDRRPGVTIEAAIPCEGQSRRWPEADRERYRQLLDRCDFETMVQHHYDRGCMLRRNRYMVDRSSLLLTVFDGSPGGTAYTVMYAVRRGVRVENLEWDTGETRSSEGEGGV